MVQVMPTQFAGARVCSTRITTSSVTVLLYKEKEYKQVIKTFSKNVEGCRDGSAKNHRN